MPAQSEELPNQPGEAQIGDFVFQENGYANYPWICKTDGEGMAMSEETLKEFLALVEEFYRRHL